MKKMKLLAALMLGLCGSMTSSFADDAANATAMTAMSSDEAAFAGQLSDANKAMFAQMAPDMRADCMKLAQAANDAGMAITPDQAVEKMASMAGGAAQ